MDADGTDQVQNVSMAVVGLSISCKSVVALQSGESM